MPSSLQPDFTLLSDLASISPREPLPADALQRALASPPFVALPGALNLRDVGAVAPAFVRPGKVFRSGTLDFLPAAGRAALRSELGVSTVFDLRRSDEVKPPSAVAPPPDGEDADITVVSCPYMDGSRMPNAIVFADFAPQADGSLGPGFRNMYDDILRGYTTGYRKVFERIRDGADEEAVLFHCTGGKDRTGVLAALILDLMGAPAEVIALDYSLTRIGGEPFRERLLTSAVRGMSAIEAGSAEASRDLTASETMEILARPGVAEVFTSEARVMADFVEHLRGNWAGAEGYLSTSLGFSDACFEKIRMQLRPRP